MHYSHCCLFRQLFQQYNTAHAGEPDAGSAAGDYIQRLFSPVWLAALIFMSITGLLYRVLGIVFAVRNPNLEGGEKAMWVIGFVLFGFITAIVFMVMATSRDLTATEKQVSIAG